MSHSSRSVSPPASIERPSLAYHAEDDAPRSTSWKELSTPIVELRSFHYQPDDRPFASEPPDNGNVELGTLESLNLTSAPGERLNETELAPVDRGFGAWAYLFAIFTSSMVLWSFSVAWGVFLEAYLRDPRLASQPHASTLLPLIGNLSSGIMYLTSPITYPMASRYPYYRRQAMWIGTAICWVSLFASSYVEKVLDLVLLLGVLYSIGGSLVFPAAMSYLSEWFVVRRGLANGVVDAGSIMGGLILPLILPKLVAVYGNPLVLRYISYAFLAGMLVSLPFLKPRIPERGIRRPTPRSSNRSWMRNYYWWLMILANTLQAFAYFLPLTWLPTFSAELNISSSTASLSLALLNGMSLLSRLTLGTLSDFLSPLLLAMFSLSATSLMTFLLWGVAGHAITGILAYAVMYGMLAGGWTSLWTGFIRPVAKDDINMYVSLYGVLMVSRGVGNVLSTPLSTALSASTSDISSVRATLSLLQKRATGFQVSEGRYKMVIVITGCCFAGAALVSCWAWTRQLAKRARASD